jgi:soluble lytic murein transglycosylase-like protein
MRFNRTLRVLLACALTAGAPAAYAGAQIYEPLSASVRAALTKAIADQAVPYLAFETESEAREWLNSMSARLEKRIPDRVAREELLVTVHYEAKRAGLDPQMVLGLIQVESAFRKYALSSAGARGFMQVMPFWVNVLGAGEDYNLFHMRTNLRFGCVILRHYLDIEKGDLYRALGRYNGSLGKPQYPNIVLAAWRGTWNFLPVPKAASRSAGGSLTASSM